MQPSRGCQNKNRRETPCVQQESTEQVISGYPERPHGGVAGEPQPEDPPVRERNIKKGENSRYHDSAVFSASKNAASTSSKLNKNAKSDNA